MGLSAPGIIVISGFLILMTVNTPVIVTMTSLAVILIVVELVPMFRYPAWVIMIDPPVFMIEWHLVLFNVFVANIADNPFFSLFFVAWDAGTKHIRNKIRSNCITGLNTCMTLGTRNIILQMYFMGKF